MVAREHGGLLTEAISWQAIFIVQIPVAVLAVPAALSIHSRVVHAPERHRPAIAPNIALVLLSAALTAAFSVTTFHCIEQPLIRHGKRLSRALIAPAAPRGETAEPAAGEYSAA